MIKIKRAYLEHEAGDGTRILVDRLWPRGLTKEKASIDLWLKDVAPSTELRKWFSHEIEKWEEFKERYLAELNENKESMAILKEQLNKGNVTLIFGARDELHNEAIILKELLSCVAAQEPVLQTYNII